MSQKRQLKKLDRKARVDRQGRSPETSSSKHSQQHPRGPSELEILALRITNDGGTDRTFYLPGGAVVKFVKKETILSAPADIIGDPELHLLVTQGMLDHHGLTDRFCEIRDTEGDEAAMRLIEGLGNVTLKTIG